MAHIAPLCTIDAIKVMNHSDRQAGIGLIGVLLRHTATDKFYDGSEHTHWRCDDASILKQTYLSQAVI